MAHTPPSHYCIEHELQEGSGFRFGLQERIAYRRLPFVGMGGGIHHILVSSGVSKIAKWQIHYFKPILRYIKYAYNVKKKPSLFRSFEVEVGMPC